ncbi:ribbon-helix-helix protein, CopG family [Bradyrhizobium sediminis]|uniref:ribbon-helix-helix protein, CopG family n=1 Tax=Bradyrhizobium sediminis TaxID=2840469 RepID=UPI00350F7213
MTLSIVRHRVNRWDKELQRITIMLDDDLTDELDRMIVGQGYRNRSEAIRDFIRASMQQAAQKIGEGSHRH